MYKLLSLKTENTPLCDEVIEFDVTFVCLSFARLKKDTNTSSIIHQCNRGESAVCVFYILLC